MRIKGRQVFVLCATRSTKSACRDRPAAADTERSAAGSCRVLRVRRTPKNVTVVLLGGADEVHEPAPVTRAQLQYGLLNPISFALVVLRPISVKDRDYLGRRFARGTSILPPHELTLA
jgi:hypothetical protein